MIKKSYLSVFERVLLIFLMVVPLTFWALIFSMTATLENRIPILVCAALFCIIITLGVFVLHKIQRKYFVAYSDELCASLDTLINDRNADAFNLNEETLPSKIKLRLKQLYDITGALAHESNDQKEALQRIISDISHQLKTPLSNITLYTDTLMNSELPPDKQRLFMKNVHAQVSKLSFLITVLMKMSRLENNLIVLSPQHTHFYTTLAEAVGGIALNAEKKQIDVQVHCDENLLLFHDPKWTAEALFNLLDNAVKYTKEGGTLTITADQWEMYTKIDIKDTGIGIAPEHVTDIFKRFYREPKVHNTPGIGVGLYLTRDIIMKQNGYFKVHSIPGKGSIFSVFLPNRDLL